MGKFFTETYVSFYNNDAKKYKEFKKNRGALIIIPNRLKDIGTKILKFIKDWNFCIGCGKVYYKV